MLLDRLPAPPVVLRLDLRPELVQPGEHIGFERPEVAFHLPGHHLLPGGNSQHERPPLPRHPARRRLLLDIDTLRRRRESRLLGPVLDQVERDPRGISPRNRLPAFALQVIVDRRDEVRDLEFRLLEVELLVAGVREVELDKQSAVVPWQEERVDLLLDKRAFRTDALLHERLVEHLHVRPVRWNLEAELRLGEIVRGHDPLPHVLRDLRGPHLPVRPSGLVRLQS